MKSSLRKNLIAILTAVMAILMAMFIATNVNVARADGISIPSDADAPRVSGEYTDDFYMIDGASVRLETEGIKFTTIISKAYLQVLESQGTVEFFATAKKDGGDAMAVAFKDQPTSESMTGDTYELNTYLNFNNYTGDLAEACAVDFIVETYAKITPAQGEPKYERAYKPEGNDIARSMQAVANAHYLTTGETEVENYFTVGNRSENIEGYFFSDNSGVITMAGLPEITDATDMKVYYGTKQLDATYKNGQVSFSAINVKEEDTTPYISVFTGGKVYSSKIEKATKITQSNVTDLLSLTGSETVYLAEDVDLTGITWNSTSTTFSGTFDGGNHTIKNLTTQASNGFIKGGDGVTIKNVAFTNVTTTSSSGALFYQPKAITVDNVFIQIIGGTGESGTGRPGAIFERGNYNSPVLVKDTVIYMPGTNSREAIFGYKTTGLARLTNVHVINLPSEKLSIQTADGVEPNVAVDSTYTFHTDLAKFATAKTTLTTFLDDCVDKYLDFVVITQENVGDLLTLKGNETVILGGDIDLSSYTEWISNVAFSGVFDGGEYTIKNLTVPTNGTAGFYPGFFKTIQGTFRNVAFTNVWLKGNCAVLAGGLSGKLTVSNVFIQVSKASGAYRTGVIVERVTSPYLLEIEDVVATMPGTANKQKVFGNTFSNATANLKNFYGIGIGTDLNNPYAENTPTGTLNKDNVNFYADLASFNSATKTLTTFLTSCVAKYLNANA